MKYLHIYIIVLLFNTLMVSSQEVSNSRNKWRIGLTTSVESNQSSSFLQLGSFTSYFAEYDQFNYKVGVQIEYQLNNKFSIITALNYANRDFTGTNNCSLCTFIRNPEPEHIEYRFVDIPVSIRYYILQDKIRFFGELGINNVILIDNEIVANNYGLGLRLATGIEYNLNSNFALQAILDYSNHNINYFDNEVSELNLISYGIGIVKRL